MLVSLSAEGKLNTFVDWIDEKLDIEKLRTLLLAWIRDEWTAANKSQQKQMSDITEIILTRDLKEVLKDPRIVPLRLLDSAVFLKSQIEGVFKSGKTGKLE